MIQWKQDCRCRAQKWKKQPITKPVPSILFSLFDSSDVAYDSDDHAIFTADSYSKLINYMLANGKNSRIPIQ